MLPQFFVARGRLTAEFRRLFSPVFHIFSHIRGVGFQLVVSGGGLRVQQRGMPAEFVIFACGLFSHIDGRRLQFLIRGGGLRADIGGAAAQVLIRSEKAAFHIGERRVRQGARDSFFLCQHSIQILIHIRMQMLERDDVRHRVNKGMALVTQGIVENLAEKFAPPPVKREQEIARRSPYDSELSMAWKTERFRLLAIRL